MSKVDPVTGEVLDDKTVPDWKFLDCNQDVYDLAKDVLDTFYPNKPDMHSANIRYMFFTKRKSYRGKTTFAYITYLSDFEKYLDSRSASFTGNSCDYIIFIDFNLWSVMSEEDKVRILRHELRHTDITYNRSGDIVYGVRDHDFVDFKDDMVIEEAAAGSSMSWHDRLSMIAVEVYG